MMHRAVREQNRLAGADSLCNAAWVGPAHLLLESRERRSQRPTTCSTRLARREGERLLSFSSIQLPAGVKVKGQDTRSKNHGDTTPRTEIRNSDARKDGMGVVKA